MSQKKDKEKKDFSDANLPLDEQGRVYHIGVKYGEVANRLITVGDPNRAEKFSKLLDKISFHLKSDRGFNTYTGLKNNVPITIMSIGMGMPMIDFMMRETQQVVQGHMCIIRIGTCGTPNPDVSVGTIAIARESACIQTNYDVFNGSSEGFYYNISSTVSANEELVEDLKSRFDEQDILNVVGTDVTTDSFYGSQGRVGGYFQDHNETLIDDIISKYPTTVSIQMETFHMYHMGKLCKNKIDTAAIAIVLAQRKSNEFLSNERKHELEAIAGNIAISTLEHWKIEEELNGEHCVWLKEN